PAIFPSSVAMAVSTTTAFPRPPSTVVPMNTRFFRSPRNVSRGNASVALLTGSDSPVREASFTRRLAASRRRASAGTRSPAARTITSPGTSSREGTATTPPSRTACALGAARGEPRGRITGREADQRALQALEDGFWPERVPVVRHRAPNNRTRNKAHHGHLLELDPRPVPR